MYNQISPKYTMSLIQMINDKLFELYKTYKEVGRYIERWHTYDIDGCGNIYNENFSVAIHEGKLDVKSTLSSVDGETLLKMAIDLGIETPDFIPCIPTFRNVLKSNFETASKIFEDAFKNVDENPSLSVGLANSALESIIKEILTDNRFNCYNEKDTLTTLIGKICKQFETDFQELCPKDVIPLTKTLTTICSKIEELRSQKTFFHGKTESQAVITEPLVACLIVNSVASVGLFILNFYRAKYPKNETLAAVDDDLPF